MTGSEGATRRSAAGDGDWARPGGAVRRGAGAFEEDGGDCVAGGAPSCSCLSIGVSIWQPGRSFWVGGDGPRLEPRIHLLNST